MLIRKVSQTLQPSHAFILSGWKALCVPKERGQLFQGEISLFSHSSHPHMALEQEKQLYAQRL